MIDQECENRCTCCPEASSIGLWALECLNRMGALWAERGEAERGRLYLNLSKDLFEKMSAAAQSMGSDEDASSHDLPQSYQEAYAYTLFFLAQIASAFDEKTLVLSLCSPCSCDCILSLALSFFLCLLAFFFSFFIEFLCFYLNMKSSFFKKKKKKRTVPFSYPTLLTSCWFVNDWGAV